MANAVRFAASYRPKSGSRCPPTQRRPFGSKPCVDAQILCRDDLLWPEDWRPLVVQDRGKARDVYIQPFMRPFEELSDTALLYSWTSYHPAALLWRVSYWHTHDRFVVLSKMFTDSSIPDFQWRDFIPAIYYQAWRRFLSCFSSKKSSNPEKDAALRDVLPLFHNQCIQMPFRFLTDQEVLQVSGLSHNFASIQRHKHLLTSKTIRSFIGNSFHPKLICMAIGTTESIQAWIRGQIVCTFGVSTPDEVRRNYVIFKQEIEEFFRRKGRNTQVTLVAEPYRHINYKAIVMTPTARPKVAQTIVAQKLPHYLAKEAFDQSKSVERDKRLDIFGKEPFRQFLADISLSHYVEQTSVPQWIFVDEEILEALCSMAMPSPILSVCRKELLQHRTYHRLVFFLGCLISSAKDANFGFIIRWTIHTPVHIRYLGPSRATQIYLFRLHDTLEILLLKFGGAPVRIRQPSTLHAQYRSVFGFQRTSIGVGTQHISAFAWQQNQICTVTKEPWRYSITEPGCALWRLSHNLLVELGRMNKEPFANVCHLPLATFPIILIGGCIEGGCLSICPQSAQAAYPSQQSMIWSLQQPPTNCVLLIYCHSTTTTTHFEKIVTFTSEQQSTITTLPTEAAVRQAANELPAEACIDDCLLMVFSNGWYACTQGEISHILFRRASALLHG